MNRRNGTALIAGVTAIVLVAGICLFGLPLLLAGGIVAQAAACGPLPVAPDPSTSSGPPGAVFEQWDDRQVTNAAAIVATGRQLGVPPRGYTVALATAMQESTLLNLGNPTVPGSLTLPHQGEGTNFDSVGLFQQRPSQGWGTVAELQTPGTAARRFYERLLTVPGWEQMRVTDAAQAVQRSGFPEAYEDWAQPAAWLAAHVLGLPNLDIIGGGDPLAPCGPGQFGPIPVGPGGWVQPVKAPIVSPYGPRGGRLHAGVDLGYPGIRGQPIRAAATGTVITARCDDSTPNCNIDGSPTTRGCGWYVDIRHPGGIGTRYCHMIRAPFVQVGQTVPAGAVIGLVGTSGNSSGPHLHFQIHTGLGDTGRLTNDNSTNPVPFMTAAGAPLGA